MSKKNIDGKIISSISNLVSFIKSSTKNNLVENSRSLNIEREQLIKIADIVETSITQAMVAGMDNAVNEIKKD